MEEHDCDTEAEEPVIRPWSWMQLLAVTANFVGNVGQSLFCWFDDIKDMAQAHVAVGDDRRNAYASLHRDLESLPTTED